MPLNDITNLGSIAQQAQREAEAAGISLPPPLRLHIGEPGFRTPEHICQAAIEVLQTQPLTYGPPTGWPWLKTLLAEKVTRVNGYRVGPEHTAVAIGGTGAILSTLLATVGPGDEVLIPDPHWPQYTMQLATCGATGVHYPLDPANEWLPNVAQLEQLLTARTRMLIINSPANPTGAVFPRQLVAQLLDFAQRHDLYLLSDECYDEMIFEGEHVSPAALLEAGELENGRVICVYAFSKTYAMTGWRIGYVVTGAQLLKTIACVIDASYTNVSTLVQKAAAAALTGPQDCVGEMRAGYKRRRDLALEILRAHGRSFYTPHGAFYILVDARRSDGTPRTGRSLARDLLRERNVTVAPGSGFGAVAENYVRVSLAGAEVEIAQGLRELCLFADRP
ncbi:MAG TPA: aminotransferase class I/II-fold pyridoxal phosphate-dependent enzyme [Ktedonobacteraceae bacterium]|nr:aminotransferase class I/II-fold pyridoxal phosphate-dependent enzyme [Ktedonobacteraceae bacterium]